MKICFVANHKRWGGLANNGGSKTIIRSAETLKELGHTVKILTNSNKYTWHDPKCKIIKKVKHPDKYDVAIAVSVSEINNTIEQFPKSRHFWWVRGFETWRMPEEKIIKKAKKIEVLVNSSWLLQKFPHGKVAFAGLDLDFWNDKDRTNMVKWGAMRYYKHDTKRSDLIDSYLYPDSYRIINIDSKYDDKNLMEIYKDCDVWFAPTELEGFHNVPAEANLCGCMVVCNRLDSNGMGDYATDETAMRYTGYDEMLACIENPDFSKVEKMQKLLREKIGDRTSCMKKFIKLIGG